MIQKSIFSLFLLSTVALGQPGRDIDRQGLESLRAAQELTEALGVLETEALLAGDFAAQSRRDQIETSLNFAADAASQLKIDVHKNVLRLLKTSRHQDRAREALRRLRGSFRDLSGWIEQAGNDAGRRVSDAHDAVRLKHVQLLRSLGDQEEEDGNFAATCTGKSGGNFFKPQSHVECTIVGRGARAYDVQFFANGRPAGSVGGELSPRERTQTVVSKKVEAGWNPQYVVFVIDSRGNRHQVAQGRCSGGPF